MPIFFQSIIAGIIFGLLYGLLFVFMQTRAFLMQKSGFLLLVLLPLLRLFLFIGAILLLLKMTSLEVMPFLGCFGIMFFCVVFKKS